MPRMVKVDFWGSDRRKSLSTKMPPTAPITQKMRKRMTVVKGRSRNERERRFKVSNL